MSFLKNKRVLILGLLSDRSIAYGIASAMKATTHAKPNEATNANNTISLRFGLLGARGGLAKSVKRAIVALKSLDALVSF